MKVIHVIWSLGYGGAESYMFGLLKELQGQHGVRNEILCLGRRTEGASRFEVLEIPVRFFNFGRSVEITKLARLKRFFGWSAFDLVHCHTPVPFACWAFMWARRPIVYTEHGGQLLCRDWRSLLFYRLYRGRVCRFIAISDCMYRVMVRANPSIRKKAKVIVNGIDIARVDGVQPANSATIPAQLLAGRHRVGFLGRLYDVKGPQTFIDSAVIISEAVEGVVFPVVGDGPLRGDLERHACERGIRDRVLFLGFREDAIAVLKHFDVLLFTSKKEAFGMALVEAMAAGVPIVAVHSEGAVSELVRNQKWGYLVEKRDPDLLARRVVGLLVNKEIRNEFVRRARARVESLYSIERNARNVLETYKACLKERECAM